MNTFILALTIANSFAIGFLIYRAYRAAVVPGGINESAVRRIALDAVEPRIKAWEEEEARREAEQERRQIERLGGKIRIHGKD